MGRVAISYPLRIEMQSAWKTSCVQMWMDFVMDLLSSYITEIEYLEVGHMARGSFGGDIP